MLRAPRILWVFLPFVALIGGCGDDPATPFDPPGVVIDGALVPEMAEENSDVGVEIWGRLAGPGGEVEGFDLRWDDRQDLTIEARVRPIAGGGSETGSFHKQVVVRVPGPGIRKVTIPGGDHPLSFPIHVYPRGVLIHMAARDPIAGIHEELVVDAGGWAVAMRRGETPPVRTPLAPEMMRRLIDRIGESGFFALDDRYISDPPAEGLVISIACAPPGGSPKRVIAEAGLAPASFVTLAEDLRSVLDWVIGSAPDPAVIRCTVDVEPVMAPMGTPRRLVLRMENRSERPFIRLFPTEQMFDIAILDGPMDGGGQCDPGEPGGHGPGDHPLRRIWNWANDRVFETVPTELRLEPGEARTFEAEWPGTTNEGDLARDGRFHIVGIVLGDPPIQAHPTRLVVGTLPPPPPPIRLSVSVEPRSAPPGTERVLHLVAKNPTERPIILSFSSSQEYDFLLFDPESMRPGPVWAWSEGKAFLTVVYDRTIPPGGEIEWTDRWVGLLSGGMPPHPGIYELRGILTAAPAWQHTSVRIEVTRP